MFNFFIDTMGWYWVPLLPLFLTFVFLPDLASNWLIKNEYRVLRMRVKHRLFLKDVRKKFILPIEFSFNSNNFTYECVK